MIAQRDWGFLTTKPLRWILLLALGVRLAGLALFPHYFDFVATGRVQGFSTYDQLAQNLVATGVYGLTPGVPDAELPPLYSVALAALYAVFGRAYAPVVLFHSVLDLLALALLYDTARRLWPRDAKVATIATIASGLYPYLIFQTLTLIDTSLYMCGFMALIWLLFRSYDAPNLRQAMGYCLSGGFLVGAMLYLRPNILVLMPFAALWFVVKHGWLEGLRRLVLIPLIAFVLLLPWAVRNERIYGERVWLALNGGAVFIQSNNICAVHFLRAGHIVEVTLPEERYSSDLFDSVVDRDAALWQGGLEFFRDYPERIPALLWAKLLAHWSVDLFPRQIFPEDSERITTTSSCLEGVVDTTLLRVADEDPIRLYDEAPEAGLFRTLHRWYFGPLLLLAILGVALSWREWRRVSLLWAVQLSMTLVYVAFHPATRYRAPTDPLLFVFSAVALCWLWERRKSVFAR